MVEALNIGFEQAVDPIVVPVNVVAAEALCAWCTGNQKRPVPASECTVPWLHGTSSK